MKTTLHTEWTVGDVCKTNNRARGTNEKQSFGDCLPDRDLLKRKTT